MIELLFLLNYMLILLLIYRAFIKSDSNEDLKKENKKLRSENIDLVHKNNRLNKFLYGERKKDSNLFRKCL